MLTTKEFSEASGVPVGTLKRWRSKPRGNKCEGRQGVLIPAHVDEHGNVFYSEEQIEIARRLHNPNYGIPKLFEVNNTMTENTALDAQIDAQAANQAVDEQTPADVQNDATSDDSDVVTIDTQGEIVTLEQRAEKIRRLQADVQRGIIEIGFELIAAKNEIGHGNWTQWLKTEFQWTPRTAQNFMAIAERFGKNEIDFVFKPTTLVQMLALPVGSEDEFIAQQAESGKPVNEMSTREVKAAVKEFNQRKDEHTDDDVQRFGKCKSGFTFEPSTNATAADDVQSHDDDDSEDGPIDGEKICDGKISAIVTATADDDQREESTVTVEETANVPNQHVPAQGFDDDDTLEVNHSTDDTNAGDDDEIKRVRMVHNDVRRLIVRVESLIWDADFDKLTVAKDTLARLVAALETKTPADDADGQKIIDE